MKKLVAILVIFSVLGLVAVAAEELGNDTPESNDTDNGGSEENESFDGEKQSENDTEDGGLLPDITLPEINTTDLDKKLGNATKTGVEPVDQLTDFLAKASPFLLLIIGILLIVLSGFGKMIGIVLIVLALIRLVQILFF